MCYNMDIPKNLNHKLLQTLSKVSSVGYVDVDKINNFVYVTIDPDYAYHTWRIMELLYGQDNPFVMPSCITEPKPDRAGEYNLDLKIYFRGQIESDLIFRGAHQCVSTGRIATPLQGSN